MPRTQSDVGSTVAQLYDVEGGRISPGAELNDHEISPVHELGGQAMSERMRYQVRTGSSGAVAANATFEGIITGLPGIFRIVAMVVSADTGSRVLNATVSIEDAGLASGIPLFIFDSATGRVVTARLALAGAAADLQVLVPAADASAQWPGRSITGSMIEPTATNVPSQISIRGNTTNFGAGVVTVAVQVLMLFFDTAFGGRLPPAARVPFPSW